MLATDPLSLVFVSCIAFAGVFLIVSSVLGLGHGHGLHLGHAEHAPHIGHAVHAGHAAHAAHQTSAQHTAHHATQHTAHNATHTAGAPAEAPAPVPSWQTISTAFLGALNLYGLLMFLLVFGLVGYILHNSTHTAALLAILVPLLLGGAAAVLISGLLRQLFEADDAGELTAQNSQIEGQLGTVTMTIRPSGLGEVVFTRGSLGRQSLSARSADSEAIPAGTEIVILGYDQGIATVQTWDCFMASARAGHLTSPPPGEPHE
jgi:membrane protein implicated in regulation of membrane protease activity